jgi:hypothetical protein
MTSSCWQFIELKNGKWVWQLHEPEGPTTRVGPFATLEACIKSAKEYGYEQKKIDDRSDRLAS